eukprot:gene14804-biopygen6644
MPPLEIRPPPEVAEKGLVAEIEYVGATLWRGSRSDAQAAQAREWSGDPRPTHHAKRSVEQNLPEQVAGNDTPLQPDGINEAIWGKRIPSAGQKNRG